MSVYVNVFRLIVQIPPAHNYRRNDNMIFSTISVLERLGHSVHTTVPTFSALSTWSASCCEMY